MSEVSKLHFYNKCTFEDLLNALRFEIVYDLIADPLQKALVSMMDSSDDKHEQNVDVNSITQINEQPRHEMLCQNVRKIEIVTRKRLSVVSEQLKRLSQMQNLIL